MIRVTRNSHLSRRLFRTAGLRSLSSGADEDKNEATHPQLGFVGLGNMGLPMCVNLAQTAEPHAHNILVHDLNESAVAEAEWSGKGRIHAVPNVANMKDASVVVTMLPSDDIVDAVASTLLDSLSTPNSVIVDCSTVSPQTTRRWHEKATERGHFFVDAPVSGGVKGAAEASLTFMVGASDKDPLFQNILQPLLSRMGKRVLACGEARGTGAATKLCNNLALACQMIGIAEAMNLGEALGVDSTTLTNVLNTSTAKCWSSEVNNPKIGPIAQKDYLGGFGSSLMLKDLGLAIAVGKEMGVNLPLGTHSKDLYAEVAEDGLGSRDFGVILKFLADRKTK